MRFELYSGAGNRFLLVETKELRDDWSEVARAQGARNFFGENSADGLLVLRTDAHGEVWMEIYNADGSRPEACGNGLRCAGWHLAQKFARDAVRIQTDCGMREVKVVRRAGETAHLFTDMGHVGVHALHPPWPEISGLIDAARVHVGNPHCVLRVEEERSVDCERIGRAMQTHPDFQNGVNVGFLALREHSWHLRVWERGVGETEACGTGACAAAAFIRTVLGDTASFESDVHMRGGVLTVRTEANGRYHLLGEATRVGSVELDLSRPFARSQDEL